MGPYANLTSCPRCGQSWYFPNSTCTQKHFSTIPIGPVIQSLYQSPQIADHMHYLEKKLACNVLYFDMHQGKLDVYDNTACGDGLMDAWPSGVFCGSDVALQFSINSAQLRPNQPSEAWVFIWVIHTLPPTIWYTKAFVIPAAIVPGPNKPIEIDSFLFPLLYHVAALQQEGLAVFDASLGRIVPSCQPMIIFGTADSPGSA